MTKSEIAQRAAIIHNRVTQIKVSGDDAIAMGTALLELRDLVQKLQEDIEAESQAEESKQEDAGK